MKKLTVTITGPVGEGKTTLAILLRKCLQSLGMTVVVESDSTIVYLDKHKRLLDMSAMQPMEITIRQVTTNRIKEGE